MSQRVVIDRVGTIWGQDAEGRPKPVAVSRVSDHFKLSGDGSHIHLNDDRIETALEAVAQHFGLKGSQFSPTRLPVRDQMPERRGTHSSYGRQK